MPPKKVLERLNLSQTPPVSKGTAVDMTGLVASKAPTAEAAATKPQPGSSKKEEEGKKADPTPFLMGEGLFPVPAKIVAKIQRGEFVDMAELLRDNLEVERRKASGTPGLGQCGNHSTKQRREVPDLHSWIQCFGVYACVMAAKYPEKTQQLLAYQTVIVREARRCGGNGWQSYDAMFRQQAAFNDKTDWSTLNNTLYSVSFLFHQNGKGCLCTYCLDADHVSSECALAPEKPTQAAGSNSWQLKDQPKRGYRKGASGHTGPGDQICYAWNDGHHCVLPYCRFKHVCSRCQSSEHKATMCTSFSGGAHGRQMLEEPR